FDGAGTGPAWYGVARVIRDVGRESSVGGFVSNRTVAGRANRIVAADGRVKLGTNWFAVGQAAASDTTGPIDDAGNGSAMAASLVGSGRRFNYELDYNDRSPAFRAVDGFIPRVDLRSIDQTYSFRARPAAGALQAWGPDIVVDRTWDHDGRALDWAVTPRMAFQWPGTTILDVYYTAGHQALRPGEVPTATRLVDIRVNRTGFDFQSAILPRL